MPRREYKSAGQWGWIVCVPRFLFIFQKPICFVHPVSLWYFISRGKLCGFWGNTTTRRGKLFRLAPSSAVCVYPCCISWVLAFYRASSQAHWCCLNAFYFCYLVKSFLRVWKMHYFVPEKKSGLSFFHQVPLESFMVKSWFGCGFFYPIVQHCFIVYFSYPGREPVQQRSSSVCSKLPHVAVGRTGTRSNFLLNLLCYDIWNVSCWQMSASVQQKASYFHQYCWCIFTATASSLWEVINFPDCSPVIHNDCLERFHWKDRLESSPGELRCSLR